MQAQRNAPIAIIMAMPMFNNAINLIRGWPARLEGGEESTTLGD